MHDPRLSALFERYRTQSDLSALAKLFDELSPEMMRVARHVAGRGVDPEDVVQSTFLASIERAETYDSERPVVPWLMGILINQARLMNRRRATRHEEPGTDDLTSGRTTEPDDAEAIEVRTAVARALETLPETYRDVLIAHLAEGKPAHEIARDLGRPQGTVRAQLHRGLRIVRRSLPGGFAFGALALFDRNAIASMRVEVLKSAARAKSLPDSAIPVATTSKFGVSAAVAALVLAAIVGIAWIGGGDASAEPQLAFEPVAAPAPAHADLERPAPIARADAGARPPAAVEVPAERRAVASPFGSVRIAVRDARGLPVAGVRVHLIAWGDPSWHERIRGLETAIDGTCEYPHVHVGRIGVHVEGAAVQARADVEPGRETEIAVALDRGIDLGGIVLDESGVPIEGAIVEAGEDPRAEPRRVSEPTGPDGRYLLRDVPRTLLVWARSDARAASEAVGFGTPTWSREPSAELRFVLGEIVAPLEFVVVDAGGAPIAGALAVGLAPRADLGASTAFRSDGSVVAGGRAARATSDALGRVRLVLDATRVDRVAITAPGRAPREIAVEDLGTLVALGASAHLAGTARFGDGDASEEALVEARVEGFDEPWTARARTDGSWEIADVPPGPLTLRARASVDGTVEEFRGAARAGETVRWDPVLEHASVIRGVARSVHGAVAKTWLVKAVREGAPEPDASTLWGGSALAQDLRQCWTGEDGVFAVPCAAGGTYRLELRARAGWNGPVLGSLDGIRAGATDVDLRVQMERSFVRARFVDGAGRPVAGVLCAVRSNSGAEHRGESKPDGSIERDLYPGTYAFVAWPAGRPPRALGMRDVGSDVVVDFGDVQVDATGALTIRGGARAVHLALRGAGGLAYHVACRGSDAVAPTLPEGAYTVRARLANGRTVEVGVVVESGREVAIDLE